MVVFINKVDVFDEEMLEFVEMEVREFLVQYGFDVDNILFIKGFVLCVFEGKNLEFGKERIKEFLEQCDFYLLVLIRDFDKFFFLFVEYVMLIMGRGIVVIGKL